MKNYDDRKRTALILLFVSVFFFVMGFMFPLLKSGYGIGGLVLKADYIYLHTSFRFFFDKGEIFIGMILLFFTIIFPVIKYIFLFLVLSGRKIYKQHSLSTVFEIVNKWAMLDVFVIAVLLLNLKFDSTILVSELQYGTSLFAISIVLMMIVSFVASRIARNQDQSSR